MNWLRVWVEWKHQQSCHCWTVGGAYPASGESYEGEGDQTNPRGSVGRQCGLEFGLCAAIDVFLCWGSPLFPEEEDDEWK